MWKRKKTVFHGGVRCLYRKEKERKKIKTGWCSCNYTGAGMLHIYIKRAAVSTDPTQQNKHETQSHRDNSQSLGSKRSTKMWGKRMDTEEPGATTSWWRLRDTSAYYGAWFVIFFGLLLSFWEKGEEGGSQPGGQSVSQSSRPGAGFRLTGPGTTTSPWGIRRGQSAL